VRRRIADESDGAVDDAPVTLVVVFYRVPERENRDKPANDEAEGAGFEPAICGRRDGFVECLLGIALKLYWSPIAGDDEEEVLGEIKGLVNWCFQVQGVLLLGRRKHTSHKKK
jgi:hypothetical protein